MNCVLLLNNDIRVKRDFLLPLAERFRPAPSGQEADLFAVVSLQINPATDDLVNPPFDGCRALRFQGGELRLPMHRQSGYRRESPRHGAGERRLFPLLPREGASARRLLHDVQPVLLRGRRIELAGIAARVAHPLRTSQRRFAPAPTPRRAIMWSRSTRRPCATLFSFTGCCWMAHARGLCTSCASFHACCCGPCAANLRMHRACGRRFVRSPRSGKCGLPVAGPRSGSCLRSWIAFGLQKALEVIFQPGDGLLGRPFARGQLLAGRALPSRGDGITQQPAHRLCQRRGDLGRKGSR